MVMRWILLVFYSFLIFSCSSTTPVDEDLNTITKSTKSKDGNFEMVVESEYEEVECEDDSISCDVLVSWIYQAFVETDYQGTVDEARNAIACNCAVTHSDGIYSYLARAYVELGDNERAIKSIDKGLSYDSENIELIELAIWNAKSSNNPEEEISYLELLLSIKREITVFEQLSDTYRRQKQYNDQIRILKEWLKIDPNSNKANEELKLAFKKTGRDEFEIDKERCSKNPENFEFCFDYAENLMNARRFDESLEVLVDMEKRHSKNEKILKNIAEISLNNYDEDTALETYIKLIKINSSEISYFIEISRIYQDKEKYRDAHKWANKALKLDASSGEAIFNFAEVLKNSVESCSKDNLDLADKAVYEIAFKYYMRAYKKGHKESKSMINWFKDNKENVLPKLEDWFLVDVDGDKLKPIEIDSNKICYEWVEQTVERVKK